MSFIAAPNQPHLNDEFSRDELSQEGANGIGVVASVVGVAAVATGIGIGVLGREELIGTFTNDVSLGTEEARCSAVPVDDAIVVVADDRERVWTGKTRHTGIARIALEGPFTLSGNGRPKLHVRVTENDRVATAEIDLPPASFYEHLASSSSTITDFEAFFRVFPEVALPQDGAVMTRHAELLAEKAASADRERNTREQLYAELKQKAADAWRRTNVKNLAAIDEIALDFGEDALPVGAQTLKAKLLAKAEADAERSEQIKRAREARLLTAVRERLKRADTAGARAFIEKAEVNGTDTTAAKEALKQRLRAQVQALLGATIGPRLVGGPEDSAEFWALRTLFGYRGGGNDDMYDALRRAEQGEIVPGGVEAFLSVETKLNLNTRKLVVSNMLRQLGFPASLTLVDDLFKLFDGRG